MPLQVRDNSYLDFIQCFQDLNAQIDSTEEELVRVRQNAEETEGQLRLTVEQLNEVGYT